MSDISANISEFKEVVETLPKSNVATLIGGTYAHLTGVQGKKEFERFFTINVPRLEVDVPYSHVDFDGVTSTKYISNIRSFLMSRTSYVSNQVRALENLAGRVSERSFGLMQELKDSLVSDFVDLIPSPESVYAKIVMSETESLEQGDRLKLLFALDLIISNGDCAIPWFEKANGSVRDSHGLGVIEVRNVDRAIGFNDDFNFGYFNPLGIEVGDFLGSLGGCHKSFSVDISPHNLRLLCANADQDAVVKFFNTCIHEDDLGLKQDFISWLSQPFDIFDFVRVGRYWRCNDRLKLPVGLRSVFTEKGNVRRQYSVDVLKKMFELKRVVARFPRDYKGSWLVDSFLEKLSKENPGKAISLPEVPSTIDSLFQ